jgi:hypothetical protein
MFWESRSYSKNAEPLTCQNHYESGIKFVDRKFHQQGVQQKIQKHIPHHPSTLTQKKKNFFLKRENTQASSEAKPEGPLENPSPPVGPPIYPSAPKTLSPLK